MNIEEIKKRYNEIWEWSNGRSLHNYGNDKSHASNLAKIYCEDIQYLLEQIREKQEVNSFEVGSDLTFLEDKELSVGR